MGHLPGTAFDSGRAGDADRVLLQPPRARWRGRSSGHPARPRLRVASREARPASSPARAARWTPAWRAGRRRRGSRGWNFFAACRERWACGLSHERRLLRGRDRRRADRQAHAFARNAAIRVVPVARAEMGFFLPQAAARPSAALIFTGGLFQATFPDALAAIEARMAEVTASPRGRSADPREDRWLDLQESAWRQRLKGWSTRPAGAASCSAAARFSEQHANFLINDGAGQRRRPGGAGRGRAGGGEGQVQTLNWNGRSSGSGGDESTLKNLLHPGERRAQIEGALMA